MLASHGPGKFTIERHYKEYFFFFEKLYRGGRTPSLQTFSKVSVLVHLLYEIIIRRTFQNLCLGLEGAQLRSTGLQVAVYFF
jgi:hypothetical protein